MINFRLIRHLWLFLAVAEEQNFGRAAKRLGMSQPPLSEQIQVLEQALKVKLFERSRRGAKLTPVGAAILPAVRKFAEQLERLELAVDEALAGQSGMLTIGAISTAMFDVLPGLIEGLKEDYPHLTVSVREIDSVEAVPALEAGDIDLAFARLDGDLGDSIQSLPLLEDRLMLAHQFPQRVLSFVDIEGNIAPEDCFLSRQIIDCPSDDPELFFTAFIERARHAPAYASALYAANLRHKVRVQAVRGIFESMVELSDNANLMGKFLGLPCPKMFMFGDQNASLSYLPHIAAHGVRLGQIPACGHFPMYSNPIAMWQHMADFYGAISG
ncbi:LysR family transcriptional regulator [Pseudomonas bubulae]|uniref:LysR family transcriptional regulator n=1 Tax=Pseudomonas bubulae TaxID=2316085 RepID=UPI003CFBEC7D